MAKKKAVKKKVLKKKAAVKKKAVRKKVTAKVTTTSPGASAGTNPIPARLFQGQTICLAGRFSYYPPKTDLEKFLRSEGATLSKKVTDKVDYLVCGQSGSSSMVKQAEKLNLNGALIQVVSSPQELVVIAPGDMPAVLTNSKCIARFKKLLDLGWLFGNQLELHGDCFDGAEIRGPGKSAMSLTGLSIKNCMFENSKLENLVFGGYWSNFKNSSLRNCELRNVDLNGLEDCTLDSLVGNDTQLDGLRSCHVSNVRITNCSLTGLEKSRVEDCEFAGGFGSVESADSTIVRVRFVKQKQLHEGCLSKSELVEVSFQDCEFEDLHIDGSKLNDVVFKNCKFVSVTFTNCKMRNCRFVNCQGSSLSLDSKTSVVDSEISGCTFSMTNLNKKQLGQIKGLEDESVLTDLALFKKTGALAAAVLKSSKLCFTVEGKDASGVGVVLSLDYQWRWLFSFETKSRKKRTGEFELCNYPVNIKKDDVARALLRLIAESEVESIDAGTITTKTSKCLLKPKELKQLIAEVIYEGMGKEAPSEEDVLAAQKHAKSQSAGLKKQLLAELQAGDVRKFNKHSAADRKSAQPFRKARLKDLDLSGVNFSNVDLLESDFSNATLAGANLQNAVLRKVNFTGADLSGAKLKSANLRGADLTNADLTKAGLENVTLNDAILKGAVLNGVKFAAHQDLCGIDLSGAKLTSVKLDGCSYDEKTVLPKSVKVTQMKKMRWHGGGIPPHERKQNKKAAGPIDFDQFMARLNEITDSSRLRKATKMLKAASFELFSEVTADSVNGVVKSQSDASLVYSCSLNSAGEFTCCTQNLNNCGGLRGALCKHILVLVVGLTKSGELDPTSVDEWINSSKLKQPSLDKDRMSEVLLKYKGAEAGEIDWRPTETVPEDFFAF